MFSHQIQISKNFQLQHDVDLYVMIINCKKTTRKNLKIEKLSSVGHLKSQNRFLKLFYFSFPRTTLVCICVSMSKKFEE